MLCACGWLTWLWVAVATMIIALARLAPHSAEVREAWETVVTLVPIHSHLADAHSWPARKVKINIFGVRVIEAQNERPIVLTGHYRILQKPDIERLKPLSTSNTRFSLNCQNCCSFPSITLTEPDHKSWSNIYLR